MSNFPVVRRSFFEKLEKADMQSRILEWLSSTKINFNLGPPLKNKKDSTQPFLWIILHWSTGRYIVECEYTIYFILSMELE